MGTQATTTTKFLLLLFVGASLLRLTAVVGLRGIHGPPSASMGADGREFEELGARLARGYGYGFEHAAGPTSFRAPGFPLFLAGLYKLAGHHYAVAYLSFCLLGGAACVLTYGLARELLAEGPARTAALLCLVYPPHVYFATQFASENLFAPCLGLGLWLLFRHRRTGGWVAVAVAGGILGFATLVRPIGLLLLPALGAIMVLSGTRGAARLRSAAIFGACFLAAIAPWTLRNHAVHHRFVLIATNGGSTFYGANNDRVLSERGHLGRWISTKELPHRNLVDAAPDEVTHEKVEWWLGVRWVREHATQVPLLTAYKLISLSLPDVSSGNRNFVLVMGLAYLPFLVLLCRAAIRFWSHRTYWSEPWLYLRAPLWCTVITAVVFCGDPRYRDANSVLLMVCAAVGLHAGRPAPPAAARQVSAGGSAAREPIGSP